LSASKLGAEFVDLDALIEREQGITIREIFATRGETAFRALEREAAGRVMKGPPKVWAPGGGWAAQRGAMDEAAEKSLIVYLRAVPADAARRVGSGRSRPLMTGADPEERMRDLLAAREEFYLSAEATVDTTNKTAKEVAAEVVELARSKAGW
jgi:shikimate kinase